MSNTCVTTKIKVMNSVVVIPEYASEIRVCYVAKELDFEGYGFTLTAHVSKPGQYIGEVQRKSPAERAGLKEGDRILEVNDVNISREPHKEVVARIMAAPDEIKLKMVVLDKEAGRHYRTKHIDIKRYNVYSNV